MNEHHREPRLSRTVFVRKSTRLQSSYDIHPMQLLGIDATPQAIRFPLRSQSPGFV